MKLKKVSEFLKENKDISMVGFAWSVIWRWYVLIYGSIFIILIPLGFIAEYFK